VCVTAAIFFPIHSRGTARRIGPQTNNCEQSTKTREVWRQGHHARKPKEKTKRLFAKARVRVFLFPPSPSSLFVVVVVVSCCRVFFLLCTLTPLPIFALLCFACLLLSLPSTHTRTKKLRKKKGGARRYYKTWWGGDGAVRPFPPMAPPPLSLSLSACRRLFVVEG
jgi:hypothetical protein